MNAQEVCDKYTNGLFGQKYLGGITEFVTEFENKVIEPIQAPNYKDKNAETYKDKVENFRNFVLDAVNLSWIRNNGPLEWDSVPEVKEAIEKYLEK